MNFCQWGAKSVTLLANIHIQHKYNSWQDSTFQESQLDLQAFEGITIGSKG